MRLSFIDCGMVSCSVSLWAVLGTFAVIFFLSPRGFQLPTFCAGWGSSALSLLGGFNCQPFVLVGSQLLTVLCWLVLIRCNLLSLSSGVSAVILFVHEYFSAEIFLSPQGFQLPFFRVHGRLQPGLSLLGSLSSQSLPSCCSRIVYMLYQKVVHVKLE